MGDVIDLAKRRAWLALKKFVGDQKMRGAKPLGVSPGQSARDKMKELGGVPLMLTDKEWADMKAHAERYKTLGKMRDFIPNETPKDRPGVYVGFDHGDTVDATAACFMRDGKMHIDVTYRDDPVAFAEKFGFPPLLPYQEKALRGVMPYEGTVTGRFAHDTLHTVWCICRTPEGADAIALATVAGKLPRLYEFECDCLAAWRAYPSFGAGAYAPWRVIVSEAPRGLEIVSSSRIGFW